MKGGYRPGAGRPKGSKNRPKTAGKVGSPSDIPAEILDPLAYLLEVMNDTKADTARRDRAAIAAAPFCHPRKGEGQGKKDEKADRAKAAGGGKFAAGAPPLKLVK